MGGQLEEIPEIPEFPRDKKAQFYDFFKDFRDFLAEYVRETVNELCIAEIPIKGQVKIFDGYTRGKVSIKNQGQIPVFVYTTGMGGYKLDTGETQEFFVNAQVIATTVSGTGIIGLIRS